MDTSADNANLKSQYAAQVAADLERNTAEHERISSQIAALREQLAVLEENRALLLTMRQTLGDDATADVPANGGSSGAANGASAAPESAAPESAAPKSTAPSAPRKAKKKADATNGKRKRAEPGSGRAKRAREADAPTLRDLVRDHLTQHGEPRSAAEITAAVTQAHPDREIKATVVRSTLESLVAKGQAHRTKQQKSVFYSPATPDPAADTAESGEAPSA
ncbi:hypothetical protein PS467_37620 [Streptomyces luomodiensis]|uniref:Regulatory protein n=1 Tax=Streptomyces luomodiensis TaxID=3026192 RepID=A0ABY9VFB4_9ACTN|nr:hypothetical protein [Streptomyces sp. SCA4-21]WNF00645.1 hypothetical protein PS467_37620 [Streptomyces sp. SCA4-21]